jgi:hypothetical protein
LPQSSGGISAAVFEKSRAILLHIVDKMFTEPSFICRGGTNTFAASIKDS